jgi:hypothetical protein
MTPPTSTSIRVTRLSPVAQSAAGDAVVPHLCAPPAKPNSWNLGLPVIFVAGFRCTEGFSYS